jgi:predicted O-methyltransferase YrrM
MAERTQLLAGEVYAYVLECSSREPEVLAQLRDATASVPHSVMQIGADQGQLMALLVRLIDARRCIEIGTYTGHSALTSQVISRPFWRKAGVAHRIDLRIKPALETLDELLEAGETGRFDFAFIDADKPSYAAYYERLLQLVRHGGLIAVDNTLALAGAPISTQNSVNANAMRAFNELVHRDERVDLAMLTVGEGVTLLRVR